MEYTPQQLAAIREEYAKGSTDAQFENFMRECATRKMIPGKHLYFRLQNNREKDETGAYVVVKKPLHLTSIDFFRLTADRTNRYEGQSEPIYIYLDVNNRPVVKSDVPLPSADNPELPAIPYAVKLSVFRTGFKQPLTVTARFDAYAQKKYDGGLNQMWTMRGPEQLLKCCEALALRQAFPEELGGLHIREEIREDESGPVAIVNTSNGPTPPSLFIVPVMDHKPAEGVVAPRPGEVASKAADIAPTESLESRQPENLDAEPPIETPSIRVPATAEERKKVYAEIKKIDGVSNDLFRSYIERAYNVRTTTDLTNEDWARILRLVKMASDTGGKKSVEEFLKPAPSLEVPA